MELQESAKKLEKSNEDWLSKLESVSRQVVALEETLADSRDLLTRSSDREAKLRL